MDNNKLLKTSNSLSESLSLRAEYDLRKPTDKFRERVPIPKNRLEINDPNARSVGARMVSTVIKACKGTSQDSASIADASTKIPRRKI